MLRRSQPLCLRRFTTALLFSVLVATNSFGTVGAATADKELSRVRGSVGTAPDANAIPHNFFGSEVVPDNVFAVTGPKSLATLKLPDSSVIEIGEKTIVQIGKFYQASAATTDQNVFTVNRGSVHFVVRHPDGQQANYTFQTPTSQIAVRGTEGLITVSGNGSTTVSLATGTVTVTTGSTVVTLGAGQSVTIIGSSATNATVGSVSNVNPETATTTTGSTGAAGASTGAVVGTAVGLGAIALVAGSQNGGSSPSAPAPSPIVVTSGGAYSQNGGTGTVVFGSLPGPSQSISFAQANCTGPLLGSATPAGAVSLSPASLPCTNGNIAGTIGLTFDQYGTIALLFSGSGQTFTRTQLVYGFTTVTADATQPITERSGGSIAINGAGSVGITVTQQGPSPTFAATLDCSATTASNYQTTDPTQAGVGLNTFGNYTVTGSGTLAFSLVVKSGPNYGTTGPPTGSLPAACNLVVNGAGGDTLTVPVNITTTGIGIVGRSRSMLDLPNGRKPH